VYPLGYCWGMVNGGGGARDLVLTLRGWPPRRWVTAAVLTLPLALLYVWDGSAAGIWWSIPAAVLLGGLAALVLAAYVPLPGSRRILDVGCTPCSAVAGATVLGSFLFRDTAPLDPGLNLVAGLLLVFGLAQRLNGGACGVPGVPGGGASGACAVPHRRGDADGAREGITTGARIGSADALRAGEDAAQGVAAPTE
jgi:hypothetical protein